MRITAKLKKQIIKASAAAYPDEMCGIVVNHNLIVSQNMAKDARNHFEISSKALVEAEEQGEIQAYVHSHPDGTYTASEFDKQQIELHDKPWIICAYPEVALKQYKPCGHKAHLIGRNYYHGWQDCYSLVRDFYERELNILLDNFERTDLWWENKDSPSLYLKHYKDAGFYEVTEPKYGDLLICKVGRTEHPNHALLWLGDQWQLKSEKTQPVIGNTLILHHPYKQSAKREIYGSNWKERTVMILRHKDVMHEL